MNNPAHKKITTLLLALCLLVTSAYAACMVCDSSPFTSEFTLDGSCAQESFKPGDCQTGDDCCQQNNCTDPKPETKALSRRNLKTEGPGLAAVSTTPSVFVYQNRYATLTGVDYPPPIPQDPRYLQHCSFLC